MQIIATLKDENTRNGKNLSRDKELVYAASLIVRTNKGLEEAVTVRAWMGRSSTASRVYATVWAGRKVSGHGQAGGYGYHKQSAAIADAVKSAGFTLYDGILTRAPFDFGGTGESHYEEVFKAIAVCMGYCVEDALFVYHS